MTAKKSRKQSAGSLKTSFSGKNRYFDKILGDRQFRLLVTSALGGGWNLLYALYQIALAIGLHSYWFLTMGCYYLIVCGMRASALRMQSRRGDRYEQKALKRNSFLTFFLAVVFSGVVCLTIMERRNAVYHTIVAISMAAYTFYCVVSAILNLIHLRKERTIQKILLRNCSMVYALGSLFGLERMLLGTFGSAEGNFTLVMEAASGAGIFLIIVLFGVNLRMIASKMRVHGKIKDRSL